METGEAPQFAPTPLSLQEQALANGMLYAKTDAVTNFQIAADGTRIYQSSFGQNEFDALAQEYRYNPFAVAAYGRENLRNIMKDPRLSPEQGQDRAKRYTDAYLDLILKLDHEAFPPDLTVREGIPEYIPDGLVDMGSNPSFNPGTRGREKIKIDKAEIFRKSRPLFHEIFSDPDAPTLSRERWKKWVSEMVAYYVYTEMPYNYEFKEHKDQKIRSVGLHEFVDHKLGVCRHHALMSQVLLQSFGVTSRLMKSYLYQGDKDLGDHANNLVRVEGKWYLLDSTNPERRPDNSSNLFIRSIPEPAIDLNTRSYDWSFPLASGDTRRYRSRSNMYWYRR